ncbi:hypothetical protein H310_03513 [Aphanomyces invadans]|uniref:Glutathione S-transferase C-terminal domain-containing protein n=1 Tax=Aphanomyces invadans TaxID=157072 RepID=A0A024UJ17_9STRA|nr:hypothetical protein H310_03513 [Aphanomyces invadans]ETW05852.1 hypothetical protein H310_03513 [Aphanomyces invadans]|eukprot:XP_008865629.1 hypothetical protein H310_03513 [Aphanomyces invadans]
MADRRQDSSAQPEHELISLKMSPYSLTARWALRHCGVPFTVTPYEPVVGELGLRLRLWRYTSRPRDVKKVTVPILLVRNAATKQHVALRSTLEIATYAHTLSEIHQHFFHDANSVNAWDARYQRMLAYVRGQLMSDVRANSDLTMEYAPPFLRKHMPTLARWFATIGVGVFTRKYAVESAATSIDHIRETLALMQSILSTQRYLVGDEFTYADLAMAVAIDHIAPGPHSTIHGKRKDLMLKRNITTGFEDVVAWKDRIYDQFYGTDEKHS